MGCDRMQCSASKTNSYQTSKVMPKAATLCAAHYTEWIWAINLHPDHWQNDPKTFFNAFLRGDFSGFPEDPLLRHRLKMRQYSRAAKKWVQSRVALDRSFSDRSALLLSLEDGDVLSGMHAEIRNRIEEERKSYLVKRMKAFVKDDPLWDGFFSAMFGTSGDLYIPAALIGEIGGQRKLMCVQHDKPYESCPCDEEPVDEAIAFGTQRTTVQEARGIDCFPTPEALQAWLGVTTNTINGEVVAERVQRGGNVNINQMRKALVLQDWMQSVGRGSHGRGKMGPFKDLLDAEKERVRLDRLDRYTDEPPAVCATCRQKKCRQCESNYAGGWAYLGHTDEETGKAYPVWRCEHCKSLFGNPDHVRNTASRNTSSRLIRALWQRWRFMESDRTSDVDDDEIRELLPRVEAEAPATVAA